MKEANRERIKDILRAGLPVPNVCRPVIRGLYRAGVVCAEALPFLYKFFWVEPVLRSICTEVGSGLRAERLPYIRGEGGIRIGEDVTLSGRSCFYFVHDMPERPQVLLGDGVFVGHGCTFSVARCISVGNHCLVAPGVRIHDNDGHPLDAERRIAGYPIGPEDASPVSIEGGAWIGAGASIMKGVTVGAGAVIGAASVVTDDVPADTLVAGNPARIIKKLG